MTAIESKILWREIVEEHLKDDWKGVSFATIREKLLRLKFTHNGEILREKDHELEKNYEYCTFSFPSLMKMLEARMSEARNR